MKKIKAIALLSGGLDSRLALKLLKEQGIDITALNFTTVFCNCTSKRGCKLEAKKAAEEEGIEVKIINVSEEYLEVIKSPKYGYGSGINPCLDCRIFMLKKTRAYLAEIGADFIFSGEVLGQRPMSQHLKALQIIEREAGVEGILLRPLSARLLKPTLPEVKGWIDRQQLLNLQGRSRKPQIKLAQDLGVNDYPCPAGGCLLTDQEFAKKMRDLIKHDSLTLNNVFLLKTGRHFRLDPETKIIVGRNDEENKRIIALAGGEDYLFEIYQKPGPLVLLRGKSENGAQKIAGGLALYYSKSKDANETEVRIFDLKGKTKIAKFCPLPAAEAEKIKI